MVGDSVNGNDIRARQVMEEDAVGKPAQVKKSDIITHIPAAQGIGRDVLQRAFDGRDKLASEAETPS